MDVMGEMTDSFYGGERLWVSWCEGKEKEKEKERKSDGIMDLSLILFSDCQNLAQYTVAVKRVTLPTHTSYLDARCLF